LKETLPSEEALGLLSLGYGSLVADYYWMRALYEFGDPTLAEAKYPNLEALTRRVLALDPNFVTAYYFAGTALTVESSTLSVNRAPLPWHAAPPRRLAGAILARLHLYYFKHDYVAAAEALAKAAALPVSASNLRSPRDPARC